MMHTTIIILLYCLFRHTILTCLDLLFKMFIKHIIHEIEVNVSFMKNLTTSPVAT